MIFFYVYVGESYVEFGLFFEMIVIEGIMFWVVILLLILIIMYYCFCIVLGLFNI